MNYSAELSRLDDAALARMLEGPESAFPEALWRAALAERDRRLALAYMQDSVRRAQQPPEPFPSISAWWAVVTVMKSAANVEEVYDAIRSSIASDPAFAPFRQLGYPLDLRVSFSTHLQSGASQPLPATEQMWVRTIGAGAEPNHWVGRLLNTPDLFTAAHEGSYVEFRADNRELHFVRTL